MCKKIFLTLTILITFLGGTFVFASELENLEENVENIESYVALSDRSLENIFKQNIEILSEKWRNNLADCQSQNNDPLLVLTALSSKKTLKFFFIELPIKIAYTVGKEIISLGKIIMASDMSEIVSKIEKITVEKAIDYITSELFKNEIKVGSGSLILDYTSNKGEESNLKINYIITQKEYSDETGKKYKTASRFYSPYEINVPKNDFWGNWMMAYESQDKINPFTVTIEGEMEYKMFNYTWINTPEITVEYPEFVPDFNFQNPSFWEKYVLNPLKDAFKSIQNLFNFGEASIASTFSNEDWEIIEKSEDLEEIMEEIIEIEEEVRETIKETQRIVQTEEEFKNTVEELNKENKKESFFKEDMTEEERKELLYALYKELLRRQGALNTEIEEQKKEEKQENGFCSQLNLTTPTQNSLIINEVMWMGSSENANHEWIELYNLTSEDILLKDFQLLDKDQQIKIVFDENDSIKANSFFLLKREIEGNLPHIQENKLYKGVLNNSDETLRLFNNTCVLLDEVIADPDWPAGDNKSKKSMERAKDFTWHTYEGDSFGTPLKENSEEKTKEEEKQETKTETSTGGSSAPKITYCKQENLTTPTQNSLIINEVMWMGSTESANHEWIELYNLTSEDILLKDYQLLNKSNLKVVFDENDIIKANSFFLLKRKIDGNLPHIECKTYTGALSNTNETLRLFNSTCVLLDEVIADPNWPAGDSTNRKSMERAKDLTWHTYEGDSFGTPLKENSEGKKEEEGSNNEDPQKDPLEITYCKQENLTTPTQNSLIINEVMWMGSTESPYHEWIELYNLTSEDIPLKDYQLLNKNDLKVVFDENDIIKANSLFLLKRKFDGNLLNIQEAKIYTGTLSNTNETLRLFNNTCVLLDEVIADPNWPAGDSTNRKSMERAKDLTWHTYEGDSFGTPLKENSVNFSKTKDFCENNGGYTSNNEYCIFDNGKVCHLIDFYNGTCTDDPYANGLIITEVSEGTNNSEREYIRIFNQSNEDIPLNSVFLAYYGPEGYSEKLTDWDNPHFVIPLEDISLKSSSYYQVDLSKNNRGDFKPFEDGDHISFNNGAVCLFDKDIEGLSKDEIVQSRINCMGWSYNSYFKNEISNFSQFVGYSNVVDQKKHPKHSFIRNKDSSNNLYFNRNYDALDFQQKEATVFTLPSVLNLRFEKDLNHKTNLKLLWELEKDLDPSKIKYQITYTENSDFNKGTIIELEEKQTESQNIEETIPNIKEGVDYRFRIKLADQNGNESDQLDYLFYFYTLSFDNHIYGTRGYDLNQSYNTSLKGPETDLIARRTLITHPEEAFHQAPLIDEYGNLYFLLNQASRKNVQSYDQNGLLRWDYAFRDYDQRASIYFNDAIYYFSKDTLIKFSELGEVLWSVHQTGIKNDENVLLFKNHFYFECDQGLCRRSLEENGKIELLYETKNDLSNFLVDLNENIYFIDGFHNLVKLKEGKASKLSLPAKKEYESHDKLRMFMFKDNILIYSYFNIFLIDKDNLEILKESQENETNRRIFLIGDTLYTIRNFHLYSLNDDFEETLLKYPIEGIYEETCLLVDSNQNLYYIEGTSRLVGYKTDTFEKMFEKGLGTHVDTDIVLINNKIYVPAQKDFFEFSFE